LICQEKEPERVSERADVLEENSKTIKKESREYSHLRECFKMKEERRMNVTKSM
jgi:hypothetical protein